MPSENTPDGLLVLEVEGLSIGGAVDPTNRGKGFVVFTRSDGTKWVHVKRFLHQQSQALIGFLDNVRASQFDRDPCEIRQTINQAKSPVLKMELKRKYVTYFQLAGTLR